MPKNWKRYKLRDVADVKGGKRLPKGEALVKVKTKHPYIRVKDLGNRTIPLDQLEYVPNEVFSKISRYIVNSNDVIISIVGTIGSVAIIGEKLDNANLTENCVKLTNLNEVDSSYLYYYLTSSIGQFEISKGIVGSTQPKLPIYNIKGLELNLPPLPEQKAIANILSAIDDKIENNLAINKTLEDMAMALYKHWFIDFRPFQEGEFIDSQLGPIPKGWEVKRLEDFCELTMGQSPKSEFYNNIKEGLPFHQGVKDYGERFPSDETYSTEGRRFAKKGDVLFSVRAPVGRLNIAKNKIILGRGLASMRMNNFNHFGFLFYALNTRFTEDDIIGDGTVYKSVNKSDLQNLKFLIPPNQLIKDFNHKVKPNDEKYLNNFNQNQSLTNLRDTLLPKLISGEVRLKEFQTQIETVL